MTRSNGNVLEGSGPCGETLGDDRGSEEEPEQRDGSTKRKDPPKMLQNITRGQNATVYSRWSRTDSQGRAAHILHCTKSGAEVVTAGDASISPWVAIRGPRNLSNVRWTPFLAFKVVLRCSSGGRLGAGVSLPQV